jgi:ParB family transcriptional regulator, chromosome partitioning protein
MSKADDLMSKFGGTIAGAVGRRPGPGTPTEPQPADRYAGAVRSRAFGELPVDAVERDPGQPREEFDPKALDHLAESIRRFGQLAPIRVRPDAVPGRWVVLVGERRLRACELAGLERVRVEFVEREMTEADVLAEQVVENAVRTDLAPVEKARAYRRLMDANEWTAEALAESLGVEPTSVYRCLALLKLPEDVAAKVDAGEIKATAAYEISKLQIADDQRSVAEKVLAQGLDHAGTVAEVKRVRAARSNGKGRGAKARSRKVTSRTLRTSAGKVTVENRRGLDDGAMVVALREAADQIEAQQQGRGEAADQIEAQQQGRGEAAA